MVADAMAAVALVVVHATCLRFGSEPDLDERLVLLEEEHFVVLRHHLDPYYGRANKKTNPGCNPFGPMGLALLLCSVWLWMLPVLILLAVVLLLPVLTRLDLASMMLDRVSMMQALV